MEFSSRWAEKRNSREVDGFVGGCGWNVCETPNTGIATHGVTFLFWGVRGVERGDAREQNQRSDEMETRDWSMNGREVMKGNGGW